MSVIPRKRARRQYFEPSPLLPPGIYQAQVYCLELFQRSSTGISTIHKITFIINQRGPFYGFKARAFPVLCLHGPSGDYEHGEAQVITEGRRLMDSITRACLCLDVSEIGGRQCLIHVTNKQVENDDQMSMIALVSSAGRRLRGDVTP